MQKRQKIQVSEALQRSVEQVAGHHESVPVPAKNRVRWMVLRDLTAVLDIERQSFEYSWTTEDFSDCLRRRNCAGMVATQGDRIVGFMIYELGKRRIELLNFGVDPAYRRCGIGTQMTQKLIGKLAYQGRTRITFPVRERNLEAQLFFRALGFRAVSVLRKFYDNTEEDAYMMQYQLPSRRSRHGKRMAVNSFN